MDAALGGSQIGVVTECSLHVVRVVELHILLTTRAFGTDIEGKHGMRHDTRRPVRNCLIHSREFDPKLLQHRVARQDPLYLMPGSWNEGERGKEFDPMSPDVGTVGEGRTKLRSNANIMEFKIRWCGGVPSLNLASYGVAIFRELKQIERDSP